MEIDYVNGEDVTNNKHLAEAIDMTREGSAPPGGGHGYDDVQSPHDDVVQTNRDSCFFVAIEALQKIDSAPAESQEKIDQVLEMLQSSRRAPNNERASVMAEAHGILQDVWVPPTE
jgi:hypothetical protein